MILTRPDWLPYLLAVGGGGLLLSSLLEGRRRGWVLAALLLMVRGALLAGLLVLIMGPLHEHSRHKRGAFLVAVDLSRSVQRASREARLQQVAAMARKLGAPLEVVGFGSRERLLWWGAAPAPSRLPPQAGGDLASCPATALALLRLGPLGLPGAGRLLLMSDGVLPPPPAFLPAPELKPLVLPLAGRQSGGVTALSLRLLEPAQSKRPVKLLLAVRAAGPLSGEVEVKADRRLLLRLPVTLKAGKQELPLGLPRFLPGRHVVRALLRGVKGGAIPRDEPGDNARALAFWVRPDPYVAYLSKDPHPVLAAALRAQGLHVKRMGLLEWQKSGETGPGAAVIVLDRLPVASLAQGSCLRRLKKHLAAGGGLFFIPRGRRGELVNRAGRPFLSLLPLLGLAPPPLPRKPPQPAKKKPPPAGLKPPDPSARKREHKQAPSLGLVLVIDVSGSMASGGRIRLAKEAAIAAAETLNPKDFIGVVAFNQEARIILDLTQAGNIKAIARRISRLRAGGGTVFSSALDKVVELFSEEPLAIKHAILLSDGDAHGDRPLRALIRSMAAKGITLSTVGCGRSFNAAHLSDMAFWGHGKFQPAFNAQEIPQIFTIEVERIIASRGARHRKPAPDPHPQKYPRPSTVGTNPPPSGHPVPKQKAKRKLFPVRLALPAPYTAGVGPHKFQGLGQVHPTIPRRGAWVSMKLPTGEPVLVHGVFSNGQVLAATHPWQGPWAGTFAAWEDYQVLGAQAVRYLMRQGPVERYPLLISRMGRSATVQVLDRQDRPLPETGCELVARDALGRVPKVSIVRLSQSSWRIDPAPGEPAAALDLRFSLRGQAGLGRGFVSLPPPLEISSSRSGVAGLQAWSQALSGQVARGDTADLSPGSWRETDLLAARPAWLPWLLLLALLSLLLRRFWPGRMAA